MKTKKLSPTTLIPENLYVSRDADRQVARIIEAMGRPGYVLVARQMGKTNLLLNAKRQLQQAGDAFVYVDLSNRYDSIRECFRNIIDTAIMTHEEKFGLLSSSIEKMRVSENLSLSPHREHDVELRKLLNAITGRMVIILDEIDAMTRCHFSDELFAKIRSIYMSRANIPEFSKLTYLLSGVADPGDLIKNKALSPFNIGAQIYLEDFSYTEYLLFLQKAGLQLSQEVNDYVYQWTSGNPRMVWDICSEIEDLMLDDHPIGTDTVDQIIRRLYLDRFDRPPVDHIRNLIEQDPELRNAITVIRYKKGIALSDAVKRKLYLYGITESISSGKDPAIKNRIIDASISTEWMESLSDTDIDPLAIAVQEGRFQDAIDLTESYIVKENPPDFDRLLLRLSVTQFYLSLGKYQEAISTVDNNLFEPAGFARFYYGQLLFKAAGLCFSGQKEKSGWIYRQIINASQIEPRIRIGAAIELGFLVYRTERDFFMNSLFPIIKDSLSNLQEYITSTMTNLRQVNAALYSEELRRLQVKSYFLSAVGYSLIKDMDASEKALEKALGFAQLSEHAFLLEGMLAIELCPLRIHNLINMFCKIVAEDSIRFTEETYNMPFSFNIVRLASVFLIAARNEMRDSSEQLLNWWQGHSGLQTSTQQIAALAESSDLAGLKEQSQELYHLAAKRAALADSKSQADLICLLNIYRNLINPFIPQNSINSTSGQMELYIDKYIDAFSSVITKENAKLLSPIDFGIFYRYSGYLTQSGKYSKVRRFLSPINAVREYAESEMRGMYIYIDFIEMVASQYDHDSQRQRECAQRIVKNLPVVPLLTNAGFDVPPEEIMNIRDQARAVLGQRSSLRVPQRVYSRNQILTVRYPDGRTVSDKFKRLQHDIETGACNVIDK